MLMSDLWERCRCCRSKVKWETLPKQSSVPYVVLAMIIVACGAVNLVLGKFFTTHTCKQMKINYNFNNTSNYLIRKIIFQFP